MMRTVELLRVDTLMSLLKVSVMFVFFGTLRALRLGVKEVMDGGTAGFVERTLPRMTPPFVPAEA